MENKMENKNKFYFQPDYRLLNRRAGRKAPADSGSGKKSLIDRLFGGTSETKAVESDPMLLEEISAEITAIKEQINWDQDLFTASYVVFDTETTGLQPYKNDQIISIGAVLIEEGHLLEKPYFYSLVNPGRPISAPSKKITGLTDEMLKDQPSIGPVLLRFLKFCGPRILVNHNAPFDLAFLNKNLGPSIGRRIVNPVIDLIMLTSALHYAIGDYSLENLAPRFGLDLSARHNALGDARIAADLFLKLLPPLKEKEITNLPQLAGLFAEIDPARGYPLIF